MLRALPILVGILPIRFFASEARYQSARRFGDRTFFPPGLGLRLILGGGAPFLVYVTYHAGLPFRPLEISVNPEGIHEVGGLLGLARKTVTWNGAAASFIQGLHEVLVVGRDGTTIKHRSYHVGQQEVLSELKRHNVFLQS